MSTRAQVRFATREDGVSFSEHPEKIHAQFYVHSDGYPEGLGLDIAESITGGVKVAMEIENTNIKHGDLEYIYYVWQAPGKDMWISIFEVVYEEGPCECCTYRHNYEKNDNNCIFVGTADKLIEKYKTNTNYDG